MHNLFDNKYYIQRSILQKQLLKCNYLLNISLLNIISYCSNSTIKNKNKYYILYNDILKFIWIETRKISKKNNIKLIINKFIKRIKEKDD